MLKPGGHLFVAVPWVQGYRPYPEDYWRMSFAGLRELFDKIDVETEFYSGAAEDVGYQLLRNGATEHTAATCRIERNLFQILHDVPPDEEMFEDQTGKKLPLSRFYMLGCTVNMFGRRLA